MFFIRMIMRSFSRQFKRRLLIAVTVCLSAAVSVAMLGVVFDVGDKLNAELSTYGSNIVVQPKADAVVSDLYNTGDSAQSDSADPTTFLKESDAPKIKTIFWAFNITNFAPELNIHADIDCSGSASKTCKAANVPIVGTWFAKTLHMDSGESTVAGMNGMRSWWTINGGWPKDDSAQGMVGKTLAGRLGVRVGDTITLNKTTASGQRTTQKVQVTGIYESGDSDDNGMYIPSSAAQQLADLPDAVDKIEVKALTTPDNDLARKPPRTLPRSPRTSGRPGIAPPTQVRSPTRSKK